MGQPSPRASRFLRDVVPALTAASALVLLPSPAQGQCVQTLFSESFEAGAPGWTVPGNWVIGNKAPPCAPSCAQGLKAFLQTPTLPQICGCYAAGNVPKYAPCNGDLTSPPIALPTLSPGRSLILDFCLTSFVDGWCGSTITDCNRLRIESSTKVRSYPFHKGGAAFNDCPGPATSPPYDLSDFQGEVVQLTWIPACVDMEGATSIFVDNVKILLATGHPSTYCVSSPNSVGSGAVIGWTGSTAVAQNDLFLTVDAAPPGQFGIFYFGDGMVQLPFGLGFRCVGGSISRFVPALPINAGGMASQKVDFTSPPAAGKLVPGTTWFFQFWYRDPSAGGAGFNLSDGLQATFCQ